MAVPLARGHSCKLGRAPMSSTRAPSLAAIDREEVGRWIERRVGRVQAVEPDPNFMLHDIASRGAVVAGPPRSQRGGPLCCTARAPLALMRLCRSGESSVRLHNYSSHKALFLGYRDS